MTNHLSNTSGEMLHSKRGPLLDSTALRSVTMAADASGGPAINLELSDEGRELFAAITRDHIDHRLAIVLDGRLYAAPTIRTEISDGQVQISGRFTEDEAKELVTKISQVIMNQR